MLMTIMFAPRHSPSTTITAEVELPEWERVSKSLRGLSPKAPLLRRVVKEGIEKSAQPVLLYRFDAVTSTSTDPGSGRLRFDQAIQPEATLLSFDRLTQDGLDVTMLLAENEADDRFVIQEKDLAMQYQIWRKTGPVVNRMDWFQVPVEYVSGTTTFENNQLIIVLTQSAETFLSLIDTPPSYAGKGGQIVSVRADETGLEFTAPSESGPAPEVPESSGGTLWIQCKDPKSEWVYYVNLADVKRIGPKFPGEDPAPL